MSLGSLLYIVRTTGCPSDQTTLPLLESPGCCKEFDFCLSYSSPPLPVTIVRKVKIMAAYPYIHPAPNTIVHPTPPFPVQG